MNGIVLSTGGHLRGRLGRESRKEALGTYCRIHNLMFGTFACARRLNLRAYFTAYADGGVPVDAFRAIWSCSDEIQRQYPGTPDAASWQKFCRDYRLPEKEVYVPQYLHVYQLVQRLGRYRNFDFNYVREEQNSVVMKNRPFGSQGVLSLASLVTHIENPDDLLSDVIECFKY